jgi:hypothetical protein
LVVFMEREKEIRYRIAGGHTVRQRCLILEEVPGLSAERLEREGFQFGEWLYTEASTPFLRGLVAYIDEAELRKETGFGY